MIADIFHDSSDSNHMWRLLIGVIFFCCMLYIFSLLHMRILTDRIVFRSKIKLEIGKVMAFFYMQRIIVLYKDFKFYVNVIQIFGY
jgi:hypothetical protein